MTRLINIDNGGTLTDFCLVDGGEVRYTKTLTTPYDLSRCLFDGLTKISELVYSEPRLAALLQSTDCIRYSTTQGTNPEKYGSVIAPWFNQSTRSCSAAWSFDYETLMNTRPFAGARYSTHHMGMGFELADEGEVYMICQGAGGGYGDVLERDPEAVMADVEAGYLSSEAAREIYFVVHDPAALAVDNTGTEAARAAERQARLRRGRPYGEFVKLWVTPEPPAHLPYYGSWGDDHSVIHATAWTTHGPVRVAAPASQLPQIFLPGPNVVALATQQARIAELQTRVGELEGGMSRLLAPVPADADPEAVMTQVRALA